MEVTRIRKGDSPWYPLRSRSADSGSERNNSNPPASNRTQGVQSVDRSLPFFTAWWKCMGMMEGETVSHKAKRKKELKKPVKAF
jgi:hypothetical protein